MSVDRFAVRRSMTGQFEAAAKIADAVMYEGYILYPYRASAMKNRCRWQFGVIGPHQLLHAAGGDSSHTQTEALIEASPRARISIRMRCLQLQRRTVEERTPSGDWRACVESRVGGRDLVSWDEAVARQIDCSDLLVHDLCQRERVMPCEFEAARELEEIQDGAGNTAARFVRQRWPVTARLRVAAERLDQLVKLRVRIENGTTTDAVAEGDTGRDSALRHALLGCHMLLAVEDGAFVSLLDPPPPLAEAAASCRNEHTWPVLVGPAGSRTAMLSAPIILYDYPTIAPESRSNYFDATEIDELLALRVATLTDEERRAAVATDDRAAGIVSRAAAQTWSDVARLHGTMRQSAPAARVPASWEQMVNPPDEPAPQLASVTIAGVVVTAGTRVRLEPKRRADVMDTFVAGRAATVAGIFRDLEDQVHVAVTINDDPAADLNEASGRYMYFSPEEVVPLSRE